jgi:ribonuclease D
LKIQLVDTPALYQKALQALYPCTELALDLEYDDNRHSFGFTLCLVQIATPDTCFLFDPLRLTDMAELWRLLEEPTRLKVVHSGNNDITILKKIGCSLRNILDTDVAARILNYERTSLASVLQAEFDITLDKKMQVSNWSQRPLTPPQLSYAARDVEYLLPLKSKLQAQIEQKGRLAWLQEENLILESLVAKENPDPHLKLKGAERLSPFDQHILRALFDFRNAQAAHFNKPAAFIISNELLVDLARRKDIDADEWLSAKGLHPRIKNESTHRRIMGIIDNAAQQAFDRQLPRFWEQPPYPRKLQGAEAEKRRRLILPVQEMLLERYGEFATAMVLGQGTVTGIINGKALQFTKGYAEKEVRKAASELGIDLSPLLEGY